MTNKESIVEFGKSALIGLVGAFALITSAGVWNAVALGAIGSFYGWVAGFNLIAEGFGVWSLYKKLFPKKENERDDTK